MKEQKATVMAELLVVAADCGPFKLKIMDSSHRIIRSFFWGLCGITFYHVSWSSGPLLANQDGIASLRPDITRDRAFLMRFSAAHLVDDFAQLLSCLQAPGWLRWYSDGPKRRKIQGEMQRALWEDRQVEAPMWGTSGPKDEEPMLP